MKNIKYIFAALVSFAALSCQKESLPQSTPETGSEENLVPLVLSTGVDTKTYIAANGTDVYWHTGDKIKVYSDISVSGNTANSYDFAMLDGFTPVGNFAKFEGKVVIGTNNVWAVYPSELAKTATDEGILQVNLPASQELYVGETNSFAQNLNISVAKADVELQYEVGDIFVQRPVADESLTFYNVCSLLKFTVPEGVANIKSVKITADAAIAGDMTFDYGSEKDKPEFKGVTANGSNSITMTATSSFAAGRDYYFVVAPVAVSEISIFVNTTDNKQYGATKHFDDLVQLQAGKHKNLGTLNLGNMPSFGVGFDIQDEGGFLNGTNVIFTFPSPTITNVELNVKKGETTVRSIQAESLELDENNQYTSSYLAESVSTWPYLPKGTYVISGSYEADGILVEVSGLELKIEDSPNFTVGSLDAYTSYTKYASNAVAEANALNGTSIYVSASEVKISEKILKNSNYKDLFKVQFGTVPATNYGSANLKDGISGELTNQRYGEYKDPSYVFDGGEVNFSGITSHVTGLPFTLKLSENEVDNPWVPAADNDSWYVSWSGSGLKVGGNSIDKSVGTYKDFYVPSGSIKVSASATGSVTGGRLDANTGTISLGGNTVSSAKASASYFSDSKTVSLPGDVKQLTISTNDSRLSCSVNYGLAGCHMLVKSLTVYYR